MAKRRDRSGTSQGGPSAGVREFPMYFDNSRQSAEFARGAWALVDLCAKAAARAEGDGRTVDQITASFADDVCALAGARGDFVRGILLAAVEMAIYGETTGVPSFEVWRPLQMALVYPDDDGPTQPTPGSCLYELDGIAVSVSPDMQVTTWESHDERRVERSEAFLQRVQRQGTPITPAAFAALRNGESLSTWDEFAKATGVDLRSSSFAGGRSRRKMGVDGKGHKRG